MADRQRPLLPECVEPGSESKPRVRDCELPDVQVPDGRKRMVTVLGRDMKAMLLLIDTYIGRPDFACWASFPTLARKLQISESTAKRRVAGLEKLGVLQITPGHRGSANVSLRTLCLPRIEEFSVDPPAVEAAGSPVHGEQVTIPRREGHQSTAPVSPVHAGGTQSPIRKTILETPLEAPAREYTAAEPGVSPSVRTLPSRLPRGVGWGFRCLSQGWCLRTGMQPAQLADSASISVWFAAAVERELVTSDADGARMFFALCRYVWRKRREKARPIGFLHALLEARRSPYWWNVIGNDDEEWARAALVALRNEPRQTTADRRDPEAAQLADEQQRKRDMIAQLQAAFPTGAANR